VRPFLALSCFFRILFRRPLSADVLEIVGGAAAGGGGAAAKALPASKGGAKGAALSEADARRAGAVTLLAVLQREGRLVDFVLEEIEGFDDAQVGAAVRDIHKGVRRALTEHVALEAILGDAEGSAVTVPAGFDAAAIRLTGAVAGAPPFEGTLRHHGWRAKKVDLPRGAEGIVAPAEVEVR